MKSSNVVTGLPAAPGMASGSTFIWQDVELSLPLPYICEDPDGAWQIILNAIDDVRLDLLQIKENVNQKIGNEQAAIFDAHLMMIEDVVLHDMVKTALQNGTNPEAAWHESIETFACKLENIPDAVLSARAADIRDVGRRVLARLLGKSLVRNILTSPSVIIARDLDPSQTAMMNPGMVLALCTVEGGPTSHTAILAKALGIPAIVALGKKALNISPGTLVLVDGDAGELIHDPTQGQQQNFEKRFQTESKQRSDELKTAHNAAITQDGIQIEVFANIGSIADVRTAVEYGAEGIGLFRTEFLYLNRTSMPDINQQVDTYKAVIDELKGLPLVARTLDIGGDKQAEYLGITPEPNPFLGWRGIRMISERTDVLYDQFYALLKAGNKTDLRIMLPMVSRVEEIIRARDILNQALQAVQKDVDNFSLSLQFGMMIETPAAALMVEHFAPLVDFFSIGTNDLTQYTLAMDRTNARIAPFTSSFHPAILKLIERTVTVAHEHGKRVGMCGEFAGNPAAIPFLLGIGLDEFSMAPASIPLAKRIIRKLSKLACKEIARKALGMSKADDTEAFLKSYRRSVEAQI